MAYNGKKVSIVITSCKRFHLLRRALYGLSACCEDLNIVDEILFFDDRSSIEDRQEMLKLFGEHFDKIPVHYLFFGEYSFKPEFKNYRHAMVLNTVRRRLIEMNSDYYLHLEDDYQYMTSFRLSDSIDVLSKHQEYAYVCHYQNWKHFPKEYNIKWVDNFWEWYYDPNLPMNMAMFEDKILALQEATLSPHEYVHRTWIRYQNWPHYSLRPGVHDVKKFLSIGEFSTDYDINTTSVEFEFALRWIQKYKTLCVKNFHILNLAPNFTINSEASAYQLTYVKDPEWKHLTYADNPDWKKKDL